MDMFEHDLDETTKEDDSNDEVQLTMEDDVDEHGTVTGVVTSLTLDAHGQYQFRTESGHGPVTYRVVQVTQGDDGQPQLVAGLSANQAVLHSSLSNGDSASNHLLHASEARLAYIPASNNNDHIQSSQDVSSNMNSTTGPFYVMMAPQGAATTSPKALFPRTGIVKVEPGTRVTRDDRRRATHNEVERRRRDKINSWIQQLAQMIPDCSAEDRRQEVRALLSGGTVEITRNSGEENQKSKGGILQKACDYIRELQQTNSLMAERVKVADEMAEELEALRHQSQSLQQENEVLRELLQQHGIQPPSLHHVNDTDGL